MIPVKIPMSYAFIALAMPPTLRREPPAPPSVTAQLQNGEVVVWWGQPQQGVIFRRLDILLIPLAVIGFGFALFWEYLAFQSDDSWWLVLWGLPFLLVAAYLGVGRFFFEAFLRAHFFYAVTNRRVLIVSTFGSIRCQALKLSSLQNLVVLENSDGSGNLLFGNRYPIGAIFPLLAFWPALAQHLEARFEAIANVQQVYKIIRRIQQYSV